MEKLLDNDGPRLALLDWMMPELDGPQVCHQLRTMQGHRYVYLILLTSKDSREDLVAGLDAGADDYLIKPCNPAELKARLRTGQRILRLEDTLVAAREDMRFRATHDALTSLWNRGRILEFLHSAIQSSESTAILLCDIDHFKRINDVHGHLTGDAVLREVAARLRGAVRANDAIGRYGGEEFLIVLNGCDARRLPERAEQIRKAVSEGGFIMGGAAPVSVSIGAIALGGDNLPLPVEGILNLTDTALYQAKRAGRNRVVIADPLVASEAN
jgi:two-component system, cell cycle response regulator